MSTRRIMIFLALGALAGCGDDAPRHARIGGGGQETAPSVDAPPAAAPATQAGTSTSGGTLDTLPALAPKPEVTGAPPTGDALGDGFAALLTDVMTGAISRTDKAVIEKRVREIYDAVSWGTPEGRQADAARTADGLIEQFTKFAPASGGRTALSATQADAITAMATRIAKSMRGEAKDGPGGSGAHEGSILNAAVDIDPPDGYTKLSWRTIGGFLYKEGMKLPAEVVVHHKKKVAIGGYMMSMGEYGNIHKFLLVEAQWSCCFGEPPDINQVIIVKIPADRKGVELTSLPIMVTGTFDAEEEKEGRWVNSVYRILADDVIEVD
jgi:hypothetical protein